MCKYQSKYQFTLLQHPVGLISSKIIFTLSNYLSDTLIYQIIRLRTIRNNLCVVGWFNFLSNNEYKEPYTIKVTQ